MIELPLVLVSGLLGSAHCLGMCGPFAIAIGAASSNWRNNFSRQLIYGVGRIFTYGFLGACAGFGGLALSARVGGWVRVPAMLSIVAGVFLIYQGLVAAGVVHRRVAASSSGCLPASLFAGFLRGPRPGGVFLAGVFTGLLPCGLVYAFLAMAASSGSVVRGLATMAVFGLGTLPMMAATGLGGSALSGQSRARLLRIAAWAVILAGVVCLVRGAGFFPTQSAGTGFGCPLCE